MQMDLGKTEPAGFTLVEIMVLVLLIGLLAAMAIPAFLSTRNHSQATAIANSFRIYSAAFQIHASEKGMWPPDATPGKVPVGMENQLPRWTERSLGNGRWDWDQDAVGVTAGVSLVQSRITRGVGQMIDQILDDGNLSTGGFIYNGNRYIYILEP